MGKIQKNKIASPKKGANKANVGKMSKGTIMKAKVNKSKSNKKLLNLSVEKSPKNFFKLQKNQKNTKLQKGQRSAKAPSFKIKQKGKIKPKNIDKKKQLKVNGKQNGKTSESESGSDLFLGESDEDIVFGSDLDEEEFIKPVKNGLKTESDDENEGADESNESADKNEGSDDENDSEEENDEDTDNDLVGSGNDANADEASDAELDSGDEAEDHKKALERLKSTDPEFYKFLEENDKKLLNFNLSDDEDDEEADEDEKLHKPSGDLEIASDESDFEPEDEEGVRDERVITLKLLKQWQNDILTDKSNKTINCLVKAFNAAMRRVSNENEEEVAHYKVEGSSVFNAIIQLCVLELGPAIRRFLGLKSGSKQPPHKCKKFVKVKVLLKGYFNDLLKLLNSVTSTNILNVLSKHLHYMSPLMVSFPNITKPLLKKLVHLWGTSDESVRVVAFLCILRITHGQQQNLLDNVLKMMYMTYIKNSKFVSVGSLPGINFMRRSLVEMYALDLNVSYQHVFLFIRQLAINLRNAITVNKKENMQAVYNWQFVNSLKLWGSLLATTFNKPQLQPLVYPFVQVCIGTIKLIPTAQYYPLRFHITQILIDFNKSTGVFIPILPFILEVLTNYDFNKKHQKVSMKPLHFTCLLRLSKSQLSENGFKDTITETIYGQLLEYLATHSQSIAFPDLTLICKIQIKIFLKKCKVESYKRKLTQILEKIEQNSTFVEKDRKKVNFTLADTKQIDAWETLLKNKGTPLNTYYENWNNLRNIKKRKEVTNNEAIGDYKLPALKKRKRRDREEVEKEVTLFPSDSEDGDDDKVSFGGEEKKTKRGKRGGKGKNKGGPVEVEIDNTVGDLVQDFNMKDW